MAATALYILLVIRVDPVSLSALHLALQPSTTSLLDTLVVEVVAAVRLMFTMAAVAVLVAVKLD